MLQYCIFLFVSSFILALLLTNAECVCVISFKSLSRYNLMIFGQYVIVWCMLRILALFCLFICSDLIANQVPMHCIKTMTALFYRLWLFFTLFFLSAFFSLSLPFSLSLNFQTINWLTAIAYRFDYHTKYFTHNLLLLFSFQYHKYPSKRLQTWLVFANFVNCFNEKQNKFKNFYSWYARFGSVRSGALFHGINNTRFC